jgi:hypothetical protein
LKSPRPFTQHTQRLDSHKLFFAIDASRRIALRAKIVRLFNTQIAKPRHRFSAKNLSSRSEFGALIAGAKAKTHHIHVVADTATVDLRSAVATKHHDAWLATAAGFGIGARWSTAQVELIDGDVDASAKGRAGQNLAAVAMADADARRIYFRLVCEFTAMAASVYLHR